MWKNLWLQMIRDYRILCIYYIQNTMVQFSLFKWEKFLIEQSKKKVIKIKLFLFSCLQNLNNFSTNNIELKILKMNQFNQLKID